MDYLKKIILFLLSGGFSLIFAQPMGQLYENFFPARPGTFLDFSPVLGIFLVFILFLPLLFTAFGGKNKYWWLGILLIPAVLFELYFDWQHFYFPLALGLVGWVIGWGVEKVMAWMKK